MKDYKQLEQQAKEMLAKVEEMQQEIKRLKEEEKAYELLKNLLNPDYQHNETELPNWFNRKAAIGFLEHPNCYMLNSAFNWRDTPQGTDYWNEIFASMKKSSKYKVPNEAIIQIQKWVIQSYAIALNAIKEEHGI